MIDMQIEEWKGASDISGIPAETLRWWHKTKKPCPYVKSHPSKQGRAIFQLIPFVGWLREIGKLHQSRLSTY